MHQFPSDIAFTPTVKSIQTEKGSRDTYAKVELGYGWETTVTHELKEFLAGLDTFFLGTSNASGQPYIQHRGGPPGFLRAVDEKTLGFADFGGNRQYITLGNLQENPKAFIFAVDFLRRRRIKLWGTARVVEGNTELQTALASPDYRAPVERVILFSLAAWDVNCPQHIHRRVPEEVFMQTVERLEGRIQELERQLNEKNKPETR